VENVLEWKWTFKALYKIELAVSQVKFCSMLFSLSSQNLSLQDQEDVSNLVEQLSSKDWQERMQAIDTMAEMIETRLPLFTSNIVKVKSLISFVFLSISICHFQSKLLFPLRPMISTQENVPQKKFEFCKI
jgi:hypothetical protein